MFRRRAAALAAVVILVACGCSAAVSTPKASQTPTPTPTLAPTPEPVPTPEPTATNVATEAPSATGMDPFATPTPVPTLAAGVSLSAITTICFLDPKLAVTLEGRDACEVALKTVLGRLGTKAANVTRIHASSSDMSSCDCQALVGFKDGSLQAFSLDWTDFSVGDGKPIGATAWPWKAAAGFTSPPVARGTFGLQAPSALAKRSPLPYCGDNTPVDLSPIDHAQCFIDSVLAGQPAEYIEESPGYEGGWFVSVYRFTGSGAITIECGSMDKPNGAKEFVLSWQPRRYGMVEVYTDGTRGFGPIQ